MKPASIIAVHWLSNRSTVDAIDALLSTIFFYLFPIKNWSVWKDVYWTKQSQTDILSAVIRPLVSKVTSPYIGFETVIIMNSSQWYASETIFFQTSSEEYQSSFNNFASFLQSCVQKIVKSLGAYFD